MNYGKGIAKAREMAGLSKRKLALIAGFDASYVAHIEAGRKQPSLDSIEAIANALQIPPPLLFLLSADEDDLKGITIPAAEQLSALLLELVTHDGA